MNATFADTFFYIAILNPTDLAHSAAKNFMKSFTGSIVTTDWILTELADGLCGTLTRQLVCDFVRGLRAQTAVEIIPVGNLLLERAWKLYERSSDKEWSLTDCTSFVVMHDLNIRQAFDRRPSL